MRGANRRRLHGDKVTKDGRLRGPLESILKPENHRLSPRSDAASRRGKSPGRRIHDSPKTAAPSLAPADAAPSEEIAAPQNPARSLRFAVGLRVQIRTRVSVHAGVLPPTSARSSGSEKTKQGPPTNPHWRTLRSRAALHSPICVFLHPSPRLHELSELPSDRGESPRFRDGLQIFSLSRQGSARRPQPPRRHRRPYRI